MTFFGYLYLRTLTKARIHNSPFPKNENLKPSDRWHNFWHWVLMSCSQIFVVSMECQDQMGLLNPKRQLESLRVSKNNEHWSLFTDIWSLGHKDPAFPTTLGFRIVGLPGQIPVVFSEKISSPHALSIHNHAKRT